MAQEATLNYKDLAKYLALLAVTVKVLGSALGYSTLYLKPIVTIVERGDTKRALQHIGLHRNDSYPFLTLALRAVTLLDWPAKAEAMQRILAETRHLEGGKLETTRIELARRIRATYPLWSVK
jgi:hypothetical protein